MNKFKKVLLGALSVLTLGLFVVTGTKVSAYSSDIEITYDQLTAWQTSDPTVYNDSENGIVITSEKRLVEKDVKNTDSEGNEYTKGGQLDKGKTLTITTDKYSYIKVYSYTKTGAGITVGGNSHSDTGAFIDEFSYEKSISVTSGSSTNGSGIYKIVIKNGVMPLQQEAETGEYTYIRFIFIITGNNTLGTSDFTNKLSLILDEGETGQQTKTCSPKAYNKLTLSGDTYTATVKEKTYSFDNTINTNDIYVVYVVKFTTANYSGHNVKASLNVAGTEFKTSGYDF